MTRKANNVYGRNPNIITEMRRITSSYLQSKFGYFNEKYFDGILPPCDMRAADETFGLGLYLSGTRKYPPVIYIVKKPLIAHKEEWVEEELDNIIIHEMVHLYVDEIMHRQTSLFQHGYYFRKVCRRLKREYGLDIKLSAYRFVERKKPSTPLGKLKASLRSLSISIYELIL